jgi:hypothetical protein
MVEAGTLPTPRERTARLFALGVVDPELSPDDITALLDDPALAPVAQALSVGLNDWNGTAAPPQEVIKADHAAFRLRADEPDAPDGAGPVPV